MKWIFTSVLYIMAVIMLLCNIFGSNKEKQNRIGGSIRALLIMASAVVTANATAVLVPSRRAAVLIYGVYYICVDLLLIFLLTYVQKYTNAFNEIKFFKYLVYFAAFVDAVIMLQNNFTGNVFTCSLNDDGFGNSFYKISSRGGLYRFHMFFTYILAAMVLCTLIIMIVKSPQIYRGKYITILTTFLIVIAANLGYLLSYFPFDFSLIFYAGMAFSIFYFSLVYIPKGLVERLLAFVVINMNDGLICFDRDGKCINANKSARRIFEVQKGFSAFEAYYAEWAADKNIADISSASWDEIREVSGEKRYYEMQYKRMLDHKGCYIGCFFTIHNNTDEVLKLEAERYRATHDMLTGIYNKEYFYEKTAKVISSSPETSYCIVCSDIKNFKLINDIYGVKKGDEILKTIASALGNIAGKGTIYGRISGDRFVMCLPKSSFREEDFLREAEKIGRLTGNDIYRVHIHFGVYEVTDPNIQISVMCDRASLAIKSIKGSYQDIIAYYDNHLRESYVNEQKITGEFDDAIESGQFRIFLQPQISVDGRTLGAEALVRWVHPERGLIPPNEFIGIFERTGLISRLDMYVWELACIQLKEWQCLGRENYHISVNISPKDFFFTDIYEVFTGLVEKYGINPQKLRLEITETAIMSDTSNQLALIERLRGYGFAVEIDDFGSGYSSLNMLKDMNVDTLKIDMGFLRKTAHEERSKTILQMIISLSKQLGMEVLTEGVETKEQVDFLTEFGCDIFQGYYFAKPMPVSDFEEKYFTV